MVLVLVILVSGAFLWGIAVVLTTFALLHPPRLTPARAMARLGRMTPADLGLRYENCDFTIESGRAEARVTLVGWWIPSIARSDRSVIIVHGYADSRAGALAWVPVWLDVGFNVLLFDLRGHGESGGNATSAGLNDHFDVWRIVAELRARKPEQTRQLMLFGVSLGATIALAAGETVDDLAGIVLESPVVDFIHGVNTQSWLMGLPGATVVRPGIWLAERWLGRRFAAVRVSRLISLSPAPVLAMIPLADAFLPPEHVEEITRAIGARRLKDQTSQVVDFQGATHLLPAHLESARYRDALQQFVNACTDYGLARAPAEGAGARQSN